MVEAGGKDATEQKADENKTVQQVETPEPDKYGVVTAESWKDAYPDQYASYKIGRASCRERVLRLV